MAKVIAEHIKLLAFVEPEPPPPPPIPEPPSFDDVEIDGPDIANLRGALAKARLLQLEELKEAKRKEWEIANAEAVEAAKQAIIQAEEDRKNRKLKVEVDEGFLPLLRIPHQHTHSFTYHLSIYDQPYHYYCRIIQRMWRGSSVFASSSRKTSARFSGFMFTIKT